MRPIPRGFNQNWSNVTEMGSRWEEEGDSPKTVPNIAYQQNKILKWP